MKRSSPRLVLGLTLATFTGCLISPGSSVAGGLTDVAGLLVGHHTLEERPTGCTVVRTGPDGAVTAVDIRGGAPGTREVALLDPINLVQKAHAIVLSGGSAFGLDTATAGLACDGAQLPAKPRADNTRLACKTARFPTRFIACLADYHRTIAR